METKYFWVGVQRQAANVVNITLVGSFFWGIVNTTFRKSANKIRVLFQNNILHAGFFFFVFFFVFFSFFWGGGGGGAFVAIC